MGETTLKPFALHYNILLEEVRKSKIDLKMFTPYHGIGLRILLPTSFASIIRCKKKKSIKQNQTMV